jgi:hypothetical protein
MVRDNLPIRNLVEADFSTSMNGWQSTMDSSRWRPAMRRAAVPKGSPLGGPLTQGATLKVTANGTDVSGASRRLDHDCILRNRQRLRPRVPRCGGFRGATIRDPLALHTRSSTCASCHAKLIRPVWLLRISTSWPLADSLPGYRRRRASAESTTPGTTLPTLLPGEARGARADGWRFRDVRDVKASFAGKRCQLALNLPRQRTVYATGTPVRFSDRAEIEKMLDSCAADSYRTRDLVHALVRSRVFLGELK